MKEQIFKEFDELNETLIGKEYTSVGRLKNKLLLNDAIDQTREETIREERKRIYCYVEEMLIGGDNELLKNLSNIIFDKIN